MSMLDISNVKPVIVPLEANDYNYTILELLKKKKITIETGCLVLHQNDGGIPSLDYYYNDDNLVEFYKPIGEIPLRNMSEYGINIGESLEISFASGLGCSSGIDFIELYNTIELFFSSHPITYDLFKISLSVAFMSLLKIINYLKGKCEPNTFAKALYHKKKYTEDDIIHNFSLDEVEDDYENKKAAVELLLEYYGYEYDKNSKIWILKK